jgi:hypothetical protein
VVKVNILDILLIILGALLGIGLLILRCMEKARVRAVAEAEILRTAQEKVRLDAEFLDAASAILSATADEEC